jgi:predicted amino acid-binding ACT domain protein
MEYIVTVMSRDRVGIIRDVSKAINGIDGNITQVSQTVMMGYFTLILALDIPDNYTTEQIKTALEKSGSKDEFVINVRLYELNEDFENSDSERYTLTMQGIDRKGITAKITQVLADNKINIDDYYSYAPYGRTLIIAQVSVPKGTNLSKARTQLEQFGKDFNLSVHFQHENIFKATSQIGSVLTYSSEEK